LWNSTTAEARNKPLGDSAFSNNIGFCKFMGIQLSSRVGDERIVGIVFALECLGEV
jgi:hypothetical protein